MVVIINTFNEKTISIFLSTENDFFEDQIGLDTTVFNLVSSSFGYSLN